MLMATDKNRKTAREYFSAMLTKRSPQLLFFSAIIINNKYGTNYWKVPFYTCLAGTNNHLKNISWEAGELVIKSHDV